MTDETLSAAVGQEFAVRLQATPATGYMWEVQSLPEGIELSGSDSETPGGNLPPGSSVTQVFRFRALQTGQHLIMFVLKRHWESSALASYEVKVNVT